MDKKIKSKLWTVLVRFLQLQTAQGIHCDHGSARRARLPPLGQIGGRYVGVCGRRQWQPVRIRANAPIRGVVKVVLDALIVKTSDDCITAASNSLNNNIVPIFCVSSVVGTGLKDIKQFLHLLPPGVGQTEASKLEQELPEFQIDELFDVPGVGTVAGGLVTQGIIVENMALKVGPFEDGTFKTVHVSSIRRNKAACRLVRAQQSAALALDIHISKLRRGMA